jgi:hypothetical protein
MTNEFATDSAERNDLALLKRIDGRLEHVGEGGDSIPRRAVQELIDERLRLSARQQQRTG